MESTQVIVQRCNKSYHPLSLSVTPIYFSFVQFLVSIHFHLSIFSFYFVFVRHHCLGDHPYSSVFTPEASLLPFSSLALVILYSRPFNGNVRWNHYKDITLPILFLFCFFLFFFETFVWSCAVTLSSVWESFDKTQLFVYLLINIYSSFSSNNL